MSNNFEAEKAKITSPQTIIGLRIENIKRIKLVELSPDGKTILITGANGQGKTSFVDAIWWALEGKNALRKTSEPIREGQDKASAMIEFQDFIVERKFTMKGTYLYVSLKNGSTITKPQEFLNHFLGTVSIDPTEILLMKPKEQRDLLLELLGLKQKVIQLDTDAEEVYNIRHAKGQERDSAVGALENMEAPKENLPAEEKSIIELNNKINAIVKSNLELQNKQLQLINATEALVEVNDKVKYLEEELVKAKRLSDIRQQSKTQLQTELKDKIPLDPAPIEKEITLVEALNTQIREAKKYHEFAGKVNGLNTEYSDLTKKLDSINKTKLEILQNAKLPLEGLGIDDRGLVFGPTRRTMENLSDSEQLKIAMAIAVAEKPTVRLLRIQHGESLDDDSLNYVFDLAKKNGYQPIIEKVDTSGKLGIVLENGEVVATNKELTHTEIKEQSNVK